jgi:hypothetical protein
LAKSWWFFILILILWLWSYIKTSSLSFLQAQLWTFRTALIYNKGFQAIYNTHPRLVITYNTICSPFVHPFPISFRNVNMLFHFLQISSWGAQRDLHGYISFQKSGFGVARQCLPSCILLDSSKACSLSSRNYSSCVYLCSHLHCTFDGWVPILNF